MNKLVMHRSVCRREDGRAVIYYDFVPPGGAAPVHSGGDQSASPGPYAGIELRWHPLLGEWVIMAGGRIGRPLFPNECPLCSGVREIPDPYELAVFDNGFPSLHLQPASPVALPTPVSPVAPALGQCEVVMFSSEHNTSLAEMPVEQIYRLVHVWTDRFRDLTACPEIQFTLLFENKGPEVGVTLHHPHGQIYAFSYLPPRLERRLEQVRARRADTGSCLFCDVIAAEEKDARRVIYQSDRFLVCVPFFARFCYEVHIYARRHGCRSLLDFVEADRKELAQLVKHVTAKYDKLFGFSLPYMMLLYQVPQEDDWHFEIEFYPPHRAAGNREKLKYAAGVESGTGTWINDTFPEEKAAELRVSPPLGLDPLDLEILTDGEGR